MISSRPAFVAARPTLGVTIPGPVRRSDAETKDEIRTRMGEARMQANLATEVACAQMEQGRFWNPPCGGRGRCAGQPPTPAP